MFKVGFGLLILFGIAMAKSCTELRYSLSGVVASAQIVKVTPSQLGRQQQQDLVLTFKDQTGADRRVFHTINGETPVYAAGQNVQIMYLPHMPERVRLITERNWLWPLGLLGVTLVFLIWLIVQMARVRSGRFRLESQ